MMNLLSKVRYQIKIFFVGLLMLTSCNKVKLKDSTLEILNYKIGDELLFKSGDTYYPLEITSIGRDYFELDQLSFFADKIEIITIQMHEGSLIEFIAGKEIDNIEVDLNLPLKNGRIKLKMNDFYSSSSRPCLSELGIKTNKKIGFYDNLSIPAPFSKVLWSEKYGIVYLVDSNQETWRLVEYNRNGKGILSNDLLECLIHFKN